MNCWIRRSVARNGDSNSSWEAGPSKVVCYKMTIFNPPHLLWFWFWCYFCIRITFSHKDICLGYILSIVNSFLFMFYKLDSGVSNHEIQKSSFVCSYSNVKIHEFTCPRKYMFVDTTKTDIHESKWIGSMYLMCFTQTHVTIEGWNVRSCVYTLDFSSVKIIDTAW